MKKEFFLAAYVSPPPALLRNNFDETLMEKGYKLASDALFNCCLGYYEKLSSDKENVKKALDLAEKYGLYYLAASENFSKKSDNFTVFLEENFPHPALLGHQVFDEPAAKNFRKLAAMKEQYKKAFKDKIFYVNLQPIYSPPYWLLNGMWTEKTDDFLSYEDYLNQYISALNPEFLSYDFYPFLPNGLRENYFTQLSFVRKISAKNHIPFWVYIQSCSWNSEEARVPSQNEVLWQANTSVLYGASGLQYFCFFTPYSNADKNFDVAMIDFFGNPTERYFAAKKAHIQIKSCEKFLLNADFLGVIKAGNSPLEIPLEDIIPLENIKKIDGDVLIGAFKKEDEILLWLTANRLDTDLKAVTIEFNGIFDLKITLNGLTTIERTSKISQKLIGGEAFSISYKKSRKA
ncbi:MAG: hypothetical protein RR540_04620 [Oscillospiraceae bacterium]